MKYIKWIGLIFIVLILSAGLYLGHAIAPKGSSSFAKENKKDLEGLRTTNPFNGSEPLHILLFGIDRTATKEMSKEENPTRSDVVMLFTIDPIQKKAQLLSMPRDTRIHVPGYKGKTKLGHAFAYGGHELSIETVEEFMDIDIDHYGIVDYDAVRRLVDAVGGVEVETPEYHYEDPSVVPKLVIDFKEGLHLLDGDDAVRYLRIRKMYENQDIDRIQAQQGFLMKIFDKLKHPTTFFKIPELIDIVQDNVETDLNYGQIAYLAKFGLDLDRSDIITDTLVGRDERIGELDYYIVEQASAIEQHNRFLQGKDSYYKELTQEDDNENETENSNENIDKN